MGINFLALSTSDESVWLSETEGKRDQLSITLSILEWWNKYWIRFLTDISNDKGEESLWKIIKSFFWCGSY